MYRSKLIQLCLSLAMAIALAVPGASTAQAAPPPNDNFANAEVITALPFSVTVDITEASMEPDEPQYCEPMPWTVWFSYTPTTDVVLQADLAETQIYANLNVYRAVGPGITNLDHLGCTAYYGPITFTAQGGTTYFFQAGGIYETGSFQVNLVEVPPPSNDNFAAAESIMALPFDGYVNTIAATTEAGENRPSCLGGNDQWGKTIWYRLTPDESRWFSAHYETSYSFVAVYTGDSLNNLSELGCRDWGGWLNFNAQAGTTYYFQAGSMYNYSAESHFHLEVTPPLEVGFGYWPGDPNIYEWVQFENWAWDPVEIGFITASWDFGDGSITNEWSPSHRFTADGDYTVRLRVTSVDGRMAETEQLVQVRTHDVAITKVAAPKAASAGQTRPISIYIRNNRYPETVVIELYRSTPGGFEQIGRLRQYVPVRQGNRTTRFDFTYTFTSDDAKIGKVTFKAIASIENFRDALPADNEAISSPPTKVQ